MVIIAGGSGFIGSALTRALILSGREVVVLSRGGRAPEGARGVVWDGRSVGDWAGELENAEAVVNLAGSPIGCKWDNLSRVRISSSRVGSTLMVGRAIAACTDPPRVWINASAVGVYGNSGSSILDETATTGFHHGVTEGTEGHGEGRPDGGEKSADPTGLGAKTSVSRASFGGEQPSTAGAAEGSLQPISAPGAAEGSLQPISAPGAAEGSLRPISTPGAAEGSLQPISTPGTAEGSLQLVLRPMGPAERLPATGFLAEVCGAWEQAVDRAETPGTRKVKLRIGFVLARDGGAFPVLVKLTKAFLGGAAGNGRQYVSWIHVDDLVRLVLWLLDGDVEGAVNATSPKPVTNNELMAALRKQMRRPWSPPVPAFVLRVFGRIVGPDADLVLGGQRVIPRVAMDKGFEFSFPELEPALRDLTA
jgi:NAD dependent epimerase/dehydratase family enzyme